MNRIKVAIVSLIAVFAVAGAVNTLPLTTANAAICSGGSVTCARTGAGTSGQ